jgi:predicted MFS family arabinose efflux permease
MTLVAGLIIDRTNRKFLMIIGDTVAAATTLVILWLYLTNQLQIWHLYISGALNGAFSEIQSLAYSVSIATLVTKQHYTRATSMNSAIHYSSVIIAPALAGILYYIIGLNGILLIDLVSFTIAVVTVLKVHIPQPTLNDTQSIKPQADRDTEHQDHKGIFWQLIFGFRYVVARPSLLAIIVVASLFWFAHDIGATLYSPMILARTGNDAKILGSISSAAGLGGVIGTLVLSTWGGPKRRIHGLLLGMAGAGLSKTVFGLGQGLLIWLPAQFCSSLNFPLLTSSSAAILLTKVRPDVQGRVFAVRSTIQQAVSAIAVLMAGLLADYIFQPAMMPGGSFTPIFSWLFGTGKAAGMALLYVISSLCLLVFGLTGYAFRVLRDVEIILPDHDVADG